MSSSPMQINFTAAVAYVWYAIALVWLVGLAFTKRTVRSQAPPTRLLQLVLILGGLALIAGSEFHQGWLGVRIAPENRLSSAIGFFLTLFGCLWAIWARISLGSNWSGRATVKAGHELVITGPYTVTRHPIYSGLLLAALGTGIAAGEARCLVGFILLLIGFRLKIAQEERLMVETFPDAYSEYRRRVRALVPGVF